MRSIDEMVAIIKRDPKQFYKTPEWKGEDGKRNEILERDHHECMRCIGKWKTDYPISKTRLKDATHVHHILPIIEYPYLCLTSENLISLCFSCHETVERRGFSKAKKIPLTQERW